MTYPHREDPDEPAWLPKSARLARAAAGRSVRRGGRSGGPVGPAGPATQVRPRGRYRGSRRAENPWTSYLLIVAVPLALVLIIVGFSALPPYAPNSRAAVSPDTSGSGSAHASASPSATGRVPCVRVQPPAAAPRPAGTPAATAVTTYEAEDRAHNKLGTRTTFCALPAASAGFTVSAVGNGSPVGDVLFNAVTVAAAGRHAVTIYYVSGTAPGPARKLLMKVNGKPGTILTFPATQDWQHVGALTVNATLVAGANTILFINALKPGPDLDRITVR